MALLPLEFCSLYRAISTELGSDVNHEHFSFCRSNLAHRFSGRAVYMASFPPPPPPAPNDVFVGAGDRERG